MIHPYLLTVYKANGGILIQTMDVLRPLNTIVKYLQDLTVSTTYTIGSDNLLTNIAVYA